MIFVINNSMSSLPAAVMTKKTTIRIIDQHYPIARNAAIRIGFRNADSADMITVLDDTMRIGSAFFENMMAAVNAHPGVSVFCPALVDNPVALAAPPVEELYTATTHDVENRCITIRGEAMVAMPMIPSTLTTYYGNAWIYFWTATLRNRHWLTVSNALAYQPQNNVPPFDQALFESETEIYDRIMLSL
jgi:hypothetical protein